MKEGDCKYIVSQTEKKQDLKGKFFALDEIQSGVYNVLIRNLSQEDGGTYKCGVTNQNDSQLNVKLEVENGEILDVKMRHILMILVVLIIPQHC